MYIYIYIYIYSKHMFKGQKKRFALQLFLYNNTAISNKCLFVNISQQRLPPSRTQFESSQLTSLYMI